MCETSMKLSFLKIHENRKLLWKRATYTCVQWNYPSWVASTNAAH